MYADKARNMVIIVSSLMVFVLVFTGVHHQTGIGDIRYMK